MSLPSFHRLLPFLISLPVLLAGCANEPLVASSGTPPDIRLGQTIDLLPLRTSNDRVTALIDGKGYAHVIIAAKAPKELHHIVISKDGVALRELVRSEVEPSSISAAFDRESRLHLLVDGTHLMREESKWVFAADPPWKQMGIKVQDPKFVKGDQGLIWAFNVDGKDVGVSGRWDWYGFGGGFGAGIILPWHNASKKLVLVSEAVLADQIWYLLDPQDNLDALLSMPAIDVNGNLHVVYHASREGISFPEPRYASITLKPATATDDKRDLINPAKLTQLHSFSGIQIPWIVSDNDGLFQAASAVDPISGVVFVVRAHGASFMLEGKEWGYPQKLPLSHFWEPRLAPAGGNAFHLMTTMGDKVLYLLYANGRWSAPVEIGQSSVSSGSIWSAVDIASVGRNHAFAVWPTTTSIVGRWVDGMNEFSSPASVVTGKDRSLPSHLLEFSKGNAELVIPGVVSGLYEAASAGSHRPQTKALHDAGQWETLATLVLIDNYGDNLSWYYLGRAAEEMSFCDAANRYYQLSKDLSESFWTRCLWSACQGFKLPEILEDRVIAVEAKRSAGKCSPSFLQNVLQAK